VNKRALAALSISFALSFASGLASCGPTCPAGQQSCGNSNPSPSAGGSNDDDDAGTGYTGYDGATCGALTAMKRCMTAFCAKASNPFCTCYKRNYDLTTNGCVCVDFDAKDYCERNKGDGSGYDCAAHSSGVSSYCVPVR
jgi:hypothetical protein